MHGPLDEYSNTPAVPPKTQSRKRTRNAITPLSGLDVTALLGSNPKKVKITPENPIPEFKQALDIADGVGGIRDAAQQLAAIIETQIKDSFSDIAYPRAVEELGVLREELMDLEEPGIYNDLIRQLKKKLLAEELGGDRREMWWEVRKNRLGLIEKKSSEVSRVDEEEAKAFLLSK